MRNNVDYELALFGGQTALMAVTIASFGYVLHTFLYFTDFQRCQNKEYRVHRYD